MLYKNLEICIQMLIQFSPPLLQLTSYQPHLSFENIAIRCVLMHAYK